MYDLLLRDATIVQSTGRLVADIALEDGKIAYVGGSPGGKAKEEVSAIGHFVMPGVIDGHVHFRDPGLTHKEDWSTGSRAAVRMGVTTVLDMPNTVPPTVDAKTAKAKLAIAAERSVANYGIWIGATADNAKAINKLWDDGVICGTKLFLAHTTGTLGLDDDAVHKLFLDSKGLIGVHAEDQRLLDKHHKAHAKEPRPEHNDVRPPEAAAEAVSRLVRLVRETKRRVHICHLSTANELTILEPLFGDLPITTEVTPHHLFLSVETWQGDKNLIKVNPPIRPELDRRALWTAVKRGRLNTFGSDHAPHTLEEKAADYWEAPAGMPGVETLFPLLMNAVKHGRMGLERLVEMCCEQPAAIFALEGKGRIQVGADADLILFKEGESTKLKKSELETKAGWSPFEGKEIGAPPVRVIVNGHTVARNGTLMDDLPKGQAVTYKR
jgi:dihydroorotase